MKKPVSYHAIFPLAATLGLLSLAPFTHQVHARDDIQSLSPRDAEFARQFDDFLQRVDDLAFDSAAQMNGVEESQSIDMRSDHAKYAIRVARGQVVEKLGRTRTITMKTTRSFERLSVWGRYYLLDIHPKSPLVGMLHAAIVVQFYEDGSSTIAGFLDVLETANREEDLSFMRQAMDGVFEEHGVDPAPHRRLSKSGHDEDDPLSVDNSKRRKTAMVGGSFYGSPLMQVNDENFAFMTDAYETMLRAYLTVVERRADDAYTDEDLAAQDRMRRNWLEDRFFSDPYTTQVTPFDAWALYSLPPSVKF